MAKEKETISLPAYTTAENMLKLIDALKRKNGNEEDAKLIFGLGPTAFNGAKASLKIFGITKEDSCVFTELGRMVAYSGENEKREKLFNVVMQFPPYEALLENIFKKVDIMQTEVTDVINFWGKFGIGTTERNLKDAATFFCNMIEYIGLGEFKVGRQGKQSRIEWKTEAKERVSEALNKMASAVIETTVPINPEVVDRVDTVEVIMETLDKTTQHDGSREVAVGTAQNVRTKASYAPDIIINVDMSDWSDEKIKNFFKYAYGIFEEE